MIKIEKKNGIATIFYNRPEKLNAFNEDMIEELKQAFLKLEDDKETKIVITTGSGEAYSVGHEVDRWKQRFEQGKLSEPVQMSDPEFQERLIKYKKPRIAAINGDAVGMGGTIPLSADFVIASEEARFRYPFVKMGIVPELGSSNLLPRIVGLLKAKELLLTGKIIDAEEAEKLGMVTEITPPGKSLEVAKNYGEKLMKLPKEPMRRMKSTLNETMDLKTTILTETYDILSCFETENHKKAVKEFLEKRESQ